MQTMNRSDGNSLCNATRNLIDHLEGHESDNTLQLKRKALIESAWRVFEITAEDLLQNSSPKDPDDVIQRAADNAADHLRDQILSPPWLSVDNQHEMLGIRECMRRHLKPLRFSGGLIDASVSLQRILFAQVVGGLYGLIFFPYLLWPAHLNPQTLFLISILAGSILFTAALVLVNTHWKAVLTSLKLASGATAIGILGLFLIRYASVGWFGAFKKMLGQFSAAKPGNTLKEKVLGFRDRAGGWFGVVLLLLLLPVLLLILSRPNSRMRTGDAKKQFWAAAETWLDNAMLLATSLEESIVSYQCIKELDLGGEVVSSLKMKRIIEAAYELKDANCLEEYRSGTQRLHTALGYSDKEEADADGCYLPPGVKVFSREPNFVIYWEKRLEVLYKPIGTLSEGQLVEIMQKPLCHSNGSIIYQGEVRRYKNA